MREEQLPTGTKHADGRNETLVRVLRVKLRETEDVEQTRSRLSDALHRLSVHGLRSTNVVHLCDHTLDVTVESSNYYGIQMVMHHTQKTLEDRMERSTYMG